MADNRNAIVGSVGTRETTSSDEDDGLNAVALATGSWTPETTPRDKARSHVLWMVCEARRAATKGHADDARWWSDRALRALWNVT
jgi:hypothetical protein